MEAKQDLNLDLSAFPPRPPLSREVLFQCAPNPILPGKASFLKRSGKGCSLPFISLQVPIQSPCVTHGHCALQSDLGTCCWTFNKEHRERRNRIIKILISEVDE